VTDGQKVDLVQANYESMSKYGVQGTPTVFIDGIKVTDPSPDGLRAAIEGN
jgi:protein-disulfide isomerase